VKPGRRSKASASPPRRAHGPRVQQCGNQAVRGSVQCQDIADTFVATTSLTGASDGSRSCFRSCSSYGAPPPNRHAA
jgi:hypothetical protein